MVIDYYIYSGKERTRDSRELKKRYNGRDTEGLESLRRYGNDPTARVQIFHLMNRRMWSQSTVFDLIV